MATKLTCRADIPAVLAELTAEDILKQVMKQTNSPDSGR